MSIHVIKRASKTPTTGEDDTRQTVLNMLEEIESGGEQKARDYAQQLDGWDKEIIVTREEITAAANSLSAQEKRDIQFAHARVKGFAEAQLASMGEFETELSPGLFAGQKLIPVNTAGCYIPGGRYAHIASALMSVTSWRWAVSRASHPWHSVYSPDTRQIFWLAPATDLWPKPNAFYSEESGLICLPAPPRFS